MKDHRIADKLIEQRFEEISKKTDALPKTQVNYIFVTDTHADEYLLKDENGKLTVFEPEDTVNDRINQIAKHLEIAVNTANKNDNIDFIAVGGDLMNAYCIKGKEHVLSNLHRSVAPLKNSLKPVLIAFGNHDDNAFQFLNPNIPAAEREWIISDKDWKEKVTDLFPGADREVHDDRYEYSKYYYYDLKEKRTRIIILDTMDCRRPFDENGVVNGEMRLKRICYTDQQLDWLVNRAMTAPADYNYIFISHMGIDSAVNSNRMLGGETLREIIRAFQSRSSYSFSYTDINGEEITVNADFPESISGKILFYSFGHQHSEAILYSEDINLWQVATGCENMRGGEGEGGSDPSVKWKILNNRREGDETETCIDIISAGTKVCHKFNIGPGDDAEMPYKSE